MSQSRDPGRGDRRGQRPARGHGERRPEPAGAKRRPPGAEGRQPDRVGGGRSAAPTERRQQSSEEGRAPRVPDDITGAELDRSVAAQLRSLPDGLALRVARHLVAAGRYLDADPATAYEHAVAARRLAARVAAVREACGETAYAAGRFKEALAELKAARRMTGAAWLLPVMADCERALGRPDRALALARDPAVDKLDRAGRIEMLLVEAGARRDLGDVGSAVRTLQTSDLQARTREPWLARLRYAYADALLAAGDRAGAREWFERAAGADANEATDAVDRLAEFED